MDAAAAPAPAPAPEPQPAPGRAKKREKAVQGVCFAFTRGKCTRGAACRWSHSDQAVATGFGNVWQVVSCLAARHIATTPGARPLASGTRGCCAAEGVGGRGGAGPPPQPWRHAHRTRRSFAFQEHGYCARGGTCKFLHGDGGGGAVRLLLSPSTLPAACAAGVVGSPQAAAAPKLLGFGYICACV